MIVDINKKSIPDQLGAIKELIAFLRSLQLAVVGFLILEKRMAIYTALKPRLIRASHLDCLLKISILTYYLPRQWLRKLPSILVSPISNGVKKWPLLELRSTSKKITLPLVICFTSFRRSSSFRKKAARKPLSLIRQTFNVHFVAKRELGM